MSTNQQNNFIASIAIISGLTTLFLVNPVGFTDVDRLEASRRGLEAPLPAPKPYPIPRQPRPTIVAEKSDKGYWDIVAEIESKSGANQIQYRDRKKGVTTCNWTSNPCGIYQLGKVALKDIGQWNKLGRSNRMVRAEALRQAKAYKIVTDGYGCKGLTGYQSYLIHQQGCSGIKKIIKAKKVRSYVLPNKIIKNMSNNSPYSYSTLKRTGGAEKFLSYWNKRWNETMVSL